MVNPLEVLEISIDDIQGKDESIISERVESAYNDLYDKTVKFANVPRDDGLSTRGYRKRLKEAKETLLNPQLRRQLIADSTKSDKAGNQAEAGNQTEAARQAEAAKQAVKPVVAATVKHLVKYAGILSGVGIVLMVLGTVLTGFGVAPFGPAVKGLGDLVFPFGFTAFLYKQPGRRALVFGAVGIVLVALGILVAQYSADVSGNRYLGEYLVGSIWNLGVVILLCGLASFLLRESRYAKVLEVARPVVGWWMAMTAQWPLLIRAGAHSVAIGLILQVLGFFVDILLLGNSGLARLGWGLCGSGLLLVVIGFFWKP